MRFGLLGSLEVWGDDARVVDLGGPQPRMALAVLLTAEGRVVPADALVDALWGEAPPGSAPGTLHTYVSRLRRALEPERRPRDPARLLVSEPPGYRLAVEPEDVDFRRFERLADAGHAALGDGRPDEAVAALTAAEGLWRGAALAEYLDAPFARGVAARLEERRLVALEDRLEAELAIGRVGAVAASAAEAVAAEPLRERLWATLALALYRSGRQGQALRALDQARRTLVEELGVEPGRPLRELEAAVLSHDPVLDLASSASSTAQAPGAETNRASAAPQAGGPDIVGREAELSVLHQARLEAEQETRFIVVEGDPGIGKTRLLEAVAGEARLAGAHVLWGRAHEGGAAPAFWPWLGALRPLVASLPEARSGLAPLLDLDAAEGPPGPAFRIFQAVADALAAASAHHPLVVLLDDVQWADPDSLELLTFLAERLHDDPVLVVASFRRLELGQHDGVVHALAAIARRSTSRRLTLAGLDRSGTTGLLAPAFEEGLAEHMAGVIHDRSEGNPFFARELARLLIDRPDALERGEVPAGVRDVVRQRLGRLPEPTRQLLPLTAVLGRDIEPTVLAAAAGLELDDCLERLDPALVTHLLVPGALGGLRFAHALVREVLVDDLSSLRRARLHLAAADALAALPGGDEERAEVVAEHLWEAVPVGVGRRAAAAYERAGDVASRRTAHESAERSYARAVELRRAAGDDAGELEDLLRLGATQRVTRGFGGAAGTFSRARELARRSGRIELLVELLWAEWADASSACDYVRSRPLADELGEAGRSSDDPAIQAAGLAAVGIQRLHEGGITDARTLLDEAMTCFGRIGGEPPPAAQDQLLHARAFRLLVLRLSGVAIDGEYDRLIAGYEDAYAKTVVRGFAAVGAALDGDAVRVEQLVREARAPTFYAVFTLFALGIVQLGQGEVETGRQTFDAAVRTYRDDAGRRSGLGLFFAGAALALLRAGRPDAAGTYVRAARAELDAYGEQYPATTVLIAEAELARAQGAPLEDVLRIFREAEALAVEQGALGVARRLQLALRGEGGPPQAARVSAAQVSDPSSGRTGAPRPRAGTG